MPLRFLGVLFSGIFEDKKPRYCQHGWEEKECPRCNYTEPKTWNTPTHTDGPTAYFDRRNS